jgi:aldose 1-epimerase
MPAGLGFHPYFPCNASTTYRGFHRGEWRTSSDGLPLSLEDKAEPIDWWAGKPAASRQVDTVYTDRRGPLAITWPERNIALRIEASANLPHTVVFTPPDADYFSAEPVSHVTNALNQAGRGGMKTLARNKAFTVTAKYRAHEANEKSPGRRTPR